ncbi:MAG TPA: pteridine reductase [Thiothrix sp.]|nr:pteridine reductase [Thiothrix sp.]
MAELHGKTILLTGAARRIGAVVATTLHQAGADIVIHYRNSSEAAQELVDSLNQQRKDSAFMVQADLCEIDTLPALITETISHTGRLDVLINNASSFYPTVIGSVTEKQWDDLHCSNLKAPFFLAQAAQTELTKHQGCIINMVDIHGIKPLKNHPVYSSAKAGLIMLTQALAKDLGPDIRVNGVAPGAILWPEEGNSAESDHKEIQTELLERTALKCQGTPDDIASAILFLVKGADYITGHVIPVDGGRLLNQ